MSDVATRPRAKALPQVATPNSTPLHAFGALLLRDLAVLRKNLIEFMLRTVMQPLLFVFVFTYVFPKIGQAVGGTKGASDFSSLLVAGVIAIACIFQGIQAVALPLVQEFGYSREIEDRVMAPLPVWAVAFQKLLAGAIQGLIAAAIVFPLAVFIPITKVNLHVDWLRLLTLLPLAALAGASLGLVIGTRVSPRRVPLIFGVVVIPITFLGATYYSWAALSPIPWLKDIVLLNPLVYMSEGMRASLIPDRPHMTLWAIYAGLIVMTAILGWFGITGFRNRVVS
ncbi:MAG: type transport system permease protein [Actinomycetota bacterium]|jgi:ABC-2 type transport system permease protein|nr:type transport system permease protein [Actinomycetota bacterium]